MNLGVVLRVCRERGCDDYTTWCTVLVGYAESDFHRFAEQVMQDGVRRTVGVFQQNPDDYPGDRTDVAYATGEFLNRFRAVTGDPVRDAWLVQRWKAPDPAVDMDGFVAAAETGNYLRRLPFIDGIIGTGRLP